MRRRRAPAGFALLAAGTAALAGAAALALADPAGSAAQGRAFSLERSYPAAAARQGVAVDAGHFYAISNRAIEKYDARSGARLAEWRGDEGGPIVHLNSGVVLDGLLYCAHSNYPDLPMTSSIEIFDAATLEHRGSHSFGVYEGSATWVDRRDDSWWVAFANYDGRGGQPGRGSAWTSVVRFDDEWRRVGAFAFPPELVERFAGRSSSGGAWGTDGLLYATGHDAAEVYALRLPRAGSVLELVEVLPAPIEGQGIAWDRGEDDVLWGVRRSGREIVKARLR
jgi:hypothetical protein